MPLTPEQKALERRIYNNIILEQPIEPDDPRHVPIYDKASNDPVERLFKHIDLSYGKSMQFFSGFRGSGKTTELFRLRKKLREEGFFVIYANALKYINPSEEIDITDLLVVIAGAFSDALETELGFSNAHESYWTRLKNYLTRTTVGVSEIGLKGDLDSPARELIGGLKAGVDLKLNLQTTSSFRQNLQKFLSGRIGELKRDVDNFFEDGVKRILEEKGEDTRIVFIFDQLEQIRGTLFNEQSVIQSVVRTFSQNSKLLELPYINTIYTVPPWLKFVMPATFTNPVVILPSIKQWQDDPQRSEIKEGNEIFFQVLRKRFEDDGLKEFFGEDQGGHPKASKIVSYCGGSLRDLLRLLNELLRMPSDELPFSDAMIEQAIANVRTEFLPVSIEDAHWLMRISETRSESLPNIEGGNVGQLTRFLDQHFVLYFRNGNDWYDIHPLIREEVAEKVKNNPLPPPEK